MTDAANDHTQRLVIGEWELCESAERVTLENYWFDHSPTAAFDSGEEIYTVPDDVVARARNEFGLEPGLGFVEAVANLSEEAQQRMVGFLHENSPKPFVWWSTNWDAEEEPATKPDAILVHTEDYADWVLGDHHPTQGRRFTNGLLAILDAIDQVNSGSDGRRLALKIVEPEPRAFPTREIIETVHDTAYVSQVLDDHICSQWADERPDLSALAQLFVTGTIHAVDLLINDETLTAIHLPGAKHHAQWDGSSGFCVFNDFAAAAHILSATGKRIAILDFDAHHGDGIEILLSENPDVLTFSTHEEGIFPWTGEYESDPLRQIYNRPVPGGSSGETLLANVREFILLALDFQPDLIFIAAGADGHELDPLSSLRYVADDYSAAGRLLRQAFPSVPMLIGGAGGYRPDDATPATWAAFAVAVMGG